MAQRTMALCLTNRTAGGCHLAHFGSLVDSHRRSAVVVGPCPASLDRTRPVAPCPSTSATTGSWSLPNAIAALLP